MGSGGAFGSLPSFGSPGGPGFLSPFDQNAVASAGGQSVASMANRYNQLGLGGSTPEAMDIGAAPSRTGGIPAQMGGLLGEIQTGDLGQTTQSAASAIQGKSQQVGNISGLGSLIGNLL